MASAKSLSNDIGGGGIVLGVQRVELLVEPMFGRDPRINRAAHRFDGWCLHGRASIVDRSSLSRRPKKRGPFHLVPVMAKFAGSPEDIRTRRTDNG